MNSGLDFADKESKRSGRNTDDGREIGKYRRARELARFIAIDNNGSYSKNLPSDGMWVSAHGYLMYVHIRHFKNRFCCCFPLD